MIKIHQNIQINNIKNEENQIYKYLTSDNINKMKNKQLKIHMKTINNLRKKYFKVDHSDILIKFEEYSFNWIDIINKQLLKYDKYIETKTKYQLFINSKMPNNNNFIKKDHLIPIIYQPVKQYVSYYDIENDTICVLPLSIVNYFVNFIPKYIKDIKQILKKH